MPADQQFLIVATFLNAGLVIYSAAIWFGLARKPKKIERSAIIAEMLYFLLELLPFPGLGSLVYWTGPWRALTISNIVAIVACGIFLLCLKGDDGPAVIERKAHVEWGSSVVVLVLIVGALFLAYWVNQKTHTRVSEYILFGVLAVAGVIGVVVFRHWRDKAEAPLRQKG